jgi:acyl carrier protein
MTVRSQDDATGVTATDIEQILITSTGAAPDVFAGREGAALNDLGIDSLAVLELQAVLSDRFGVVIPEESHRFSVAEIVAYVSGELSARTGEES